MLVHEHTRQPKRKISTATQPIEVKATMASKKKQDQVVRCFEVGEPRLHEKGHTIYKVTLKVSALFVLSIQCRSQL